MYVCMYMYMYKVTCKFFFLPFTCKYTTSLPACLHCLLPAWLFFMFVRMHVCTYLSMKSPFFTGKFFFSTSTCNFITSVLVCPRCLLPAWLYFNVCRYLWSHHCLPVSSFFLPLPVSVSPLYLYVSIAWRLPV